MKYSIVEKNTYDQEIKIGNKKISCYSLKKLKEVYSDGKYEIVGEARETKKEKESEADLDIINIGNTTLKVFKPGSSNKVIYKTAGYVCVGDDNYIAILVSRLPFLATLLALLLAAIIVFGVVYSDYVKNNPHHFSQVELINQLPPLDPNIVKSDIDTGKPSEDLNGGGKVSMKYTTQATLSLKSKKLKFDFENPTNSSHDTSIEVYIVSGGKQYLIASSGRVPAGYKLDQLTASGENLKLLSPGRYSAQYALQYYDSATGEKALVDSVLEDIVITVVE